MAQGKSSQRALFKNGHGCLWRCSGYTWRWREGNPSAFIVDFTVSLRCIEANSAQTGGIGEDTLLQEGYYSFLGR